MKDSNLNKKDINFNELITKVNTLTKDIHCAGIMIYIKSISGVENSYIQINSPKKDIVFLNTYTKGVYVFPDIGSKVLSSLRLKSQKLNEKYDTNGIFLAERNDSTVHAFNYPDNMYPYFDLNINCIVRLLDEAKHNKVIKDFAIIGNYNNYYCTYKFSNSVDKISVFLKWAEDGYKNIKIKYNTLLKYIEYSPRDIPFQTVKNSDKTGISVFKSTKPGVCFDEIRGLDEWKNEKKLRDYTTQLAISYVKDFILLVETKNSYYICTSKYNSELKHVALVYKGLSEIRNNYYAKDYNQFGKDISQYLNKLRFKDEYHPLFTRSDNGKFTLLPPDRNTTIIPTPQIRLHADQIGMTNVLPEFATDLTDQLFDRLFNKFLNISIAQGSIESYISLSERVQGNKTIVSSSYNNKQGLIDITGDLLLMLSYVLPRKDKRFWIDFPNETMNLIDNKQFNKVRELFKEDE